MKNTCSSHSYFLITSLWTLISIPVLLLAHYYPLTHYGYNYYGIAYNMWMTKIFWYPTWLNTINVQKPPLFYWLTNLGWHFFGLHTLVMPAIILISYLLTAIFTMKTCFVLTKNRQAALLSGVFALLNLTFLKYVTLIRFDIQLTFAFILSFYALSKIIYEQKQTYWFLFIIGNLMGLLFKGPVILLFTLPASLLAFLIFPENFRSSKYYLEFSISISITILSGLIWFMLADYNSHHFYLRTVLSQTLQRFSHIQPDPNVPNNIISHYHWWYAFGHFFTYIFALFIVPFLLIIPFSMVRIYSGIKKMDNQLLWYFGLLILIPIFIFSGFIGLVRFRYALPLIPIICILMGYCFSLTFNSINKKLENQIYHYYRFVLLLTGIIIILLCAFVPKFKSMWLIFLPFALGISLILLTSFSSKTFTKRCLSYVGSCIGFAYIFLISTFCFLYPYSDIQKSQKQLVSLRQQQLPIIEINNDATREGWTQYLARDLTIPLISEDKGEKLWLKKNQNFWVVYTTSFDRVRNFRALIYPLEYPLTNFSKIPILMPVSVYHQLLAFKNPMHAINLQ